LCITTRCNQSLPRSWLSYQFKVRALNGGGVFKYVNAVEIARGIIMVSAWLEPCVNETGLVHEKSIVFIVRMTFLGPNL